MMNANQSAGRINGLHSSISASFQSSHCIGQAGLRVGRFARLTSKPAGDQTGQSTSLENGTVDEGITRPIPQSGPKRRNLKNLNCYIEKPTANYLLLNAYWFVHLGCAGFYLSPGFVEIVLPCNFCPIEFFPFFKGRSHPAHVEHSAWVIWISYLPCIPEQPSPYQLT